MVRVLTTLVLVALLPGTAAACSLAGPSPGPGHFFLYEPATGNELEIPVHQRSLGASCELSNSFSYDGKRFAWVEGPDTYSDTAPDIVYLYDVAADTTDQLRLTGLRHQRISLSDEYLVHLSSDAAGHAKAYRYGLTTGIDQIIPITVPTGYQLLWDTQIAMRRSDASNNQFFSVYDAATSKYVLRETSAADLGLPKDATLVGFGEGWMLFAAYNGVSEDWYSYHIATDERQKLSGIQSGWPQQSSIHNGRSYALLYESGSEQLQLGSFSLTDGKKNEIGTVPHEPPSSLVYIDGTIVLGSYFNVEAHAHESSSKGGAPAGPGVARTVARPAPPPDNIWEIPHVGLILALAGIVGVAFVRRRI